MPAAYAIWDFETGGLSTRIHPPVSLSLIITDAKFEPLHEYYTRLTPPPRTAFQVPACVVTEGMFNPPIDHLLLENGTRIPCDYKGNPSDPTIPVITAYASFVNGFSWDAWRNASLSLKEASDTFSRLLFQYFGTSRCVSVAHNILFDSGYMEQWLPEVYARTMSPWYCTLAESRAWRKKTGKKGGCKLTEMAAMIDDWPGSCVQGKISKLNTSGDKIGSLTEDAHNAFVDTRLTLFLLQWLQEQKASGR
jgi:hypothetical protein